MQEWGFIVGEEFQESFRAIGLDILYTLLEIHYRRLIIPTFLVILGQDITNLLKHIS